MSRKNLTGVAACVTITLFLAFMVGFEWIDTRSRTFHVTYTFVFVGIGIATVVLLVRFANEMDSKEIPTTVATKSTSSLTQRTLAAVDRYATYQAWSPRTLDKLDRMVSTWACDLHRRAIVKARVLRSRIKAAFARIDRDTVVAMLQGAAAGTPIGIFVGCFCGLLCKFQYNLVFISDARETAFYVIFTISFVLTVLIMGFFLIPVVFFPSVAEESPQGLRPVIIDGEYLAALAYQQKNCNYGG
jgi:hypothetical protein